LASQPELVNTDPFGAGWMLKLKVADSAEADALLDPAAYDQLIAEA
jgi:glycine cleavage system H protein